MLQLFRFRGFLPYTALLFLNAFVDLGHKIVIQNTVFKIYDGQEQIVLTAVVNALILVPFILLMSPAGFCSDKYPKNQVMIMTSVAAVVLTLFITLFYYLGWFWPAYLMTLLLAIQSAIYSPAKYGYIRELVGDDHLAQANGVVQATTTVAILAGILAFSVLFEAFLQEKSYISRKELLQYIAPVGWCLVLFSLVELGMAMKLPLRKPVDRAMRFDWRQYTHGGYLRFNLKVVLEKPVILSSVIGLALFWAISQVMLAAFPAYAKDTMDVTNTVIIQGMLACAGIGVVLGSVVAGLVSRRQPDRRLVPAGAFGITLCLLILPALDNLAALSVNFILWGMMGGFLIIPLNTLIQHHARERQLGRVISASNLVQNCTMLTFLIMTVVSALSGLDGLWLIHILQAVAFIGTLLSLVFYSRQLRW